MKVFLEPNLLRVNDYLKHFFSVPATNYLAPESKAK